MGVEAERGVTHRGAHGSENVGMSSKRQVRTLSTERLRFPGQRKSTQG